MKFSLLEFFFLIGATAVFCLIRIHGIRIENVSIIIGSAAWLSVSFSLIFAFSRDSVAVVFFAAVLAGYLPCLGWAIENLLELNSSDFLRKTSLGEDFSTSFDVNFFLFLISGTASSIFGLALGLIGLGARRLLFKKR